MAAIPKAITVFNVVASLSTPVAHLAVVFAPSMNGTIANGDLSLAASLALEVGGFVHVAVNMTANVSNSVSSSKAVRASVHGQLLGLKGLLESPNMAGDLLGLGMLGVEVLDFALESCIPFVY